MATKKTEKTSTRTAKTAPKRATKVTKPPKGEKVSTAARHPRARLTTQFQSKAALAKTLAPAVARADEDTGQLEARLKIASNSQLLHLQKVVETVKQKWGNREKLIAALGTAEKKSGDKDYLAKLDSFSLPYLVELALSSERRARP